MTDICKKFIMILHNKHDKKMQKNNWKLINNDNS